MKFDAGINFIVVFGGAIAASFLEKILCFSVFSLEIFEKLALKRILYIMLKIFKILIIFFSFEPFDIFFLISLSIAIFCKTLTDHNSETVSQFELKFFVEVYLDWSYPTNQLFIQMSILPLSTFSLNLIRLWLFKP